MTTLEDLIRDGLDVDALPPGTAVILHARHPLNPDQLDALRGQLTVVSHDLGIKIAVVSHDFDVLLVPEAYPMLTVNGTPGEPEILR